MRGHYNVLSVCGRLIRDERKHYTAHDDHRTPL
jgi:hypothetical protein